MKNHEYRLFSLIIVVLWMTMIWQATALHQAYKNERWLIQQLNQAKGNR